MNFPGMAKDKGDGDFWEEKPGLSAERREVFRCGESNLSGSKPWVEGEEG